MKNLTSDLTSSLVARSLKLDHKELMNAVLKFEVKRFENCLSSSGAGRGMRPDSLLEGAFRQSICSNLSLANLCTVGRRFWDGNYAMHVENNRDEQRLLTSRIPSLLV